MSFSWVKKVSKFFLESFKAKIIEIFLRKFKGKSSQNCFPKCYFRKEVLNFFVGKKFLNFSWKASRKKLLNYLLLKNKIKYIFVSTKLLNFDLCPYKKSFIFISTKKILLLLYLNGQNFDIFFNII
jgi:hypothetical protein